MPGQRRRATTGTCAGFRKTVRATSARFASRRLARLSLPGISAGSKRRTRPPLAAIPQGRRACHFPLRRRRLLGARARPCRIRPGEAGRPLPQPGTTLRLISDVRSHRSAGRRSLRGLVLSEDLSRARGENGTRDSTSRSRGWPGHLGLGKLYRGILGLIRFILLPQASLGAFFLTASRPGRTLRPQ